MRRQRSGRGVQTFEPKCELDLNARGAPHLCACRNSRFLTTRPPPEGFQTRHLFKKRRKNVATQACLVPIQESLKGTDRYSEIFRQPPACRCSGSITPPGILTIYSQQLAAYLAPEGNVLPAHLTIIINRFMPNNDVL